MTQNSTIGRNEPCPCGSGKKYKRCCGVAAAPKLSTPKFNPAAFDPSGGAGFGGMDPKMMENFDPQMMMQMSQAIQRLPKGQLQRLQSIMQRAMSGQDVASEAEAFEKTLPPDFKNMMESFGSALGAAGPEGSENLAAGVEDVESGSGAAEKTDLVSKTDSMSVDQAKNLVMQAAKSGVISKEQADALLGMQSASSAELPVPDVNQKNTDDNVQTSTDKEAGTNKFGKFWRGLGNKKS